MEEEVEKSQIEEINNDTLNQSDAPKIEETKTDTRQALLGCLALIVIIALVGLTIWGIIAGVKAIAEGFTRFIQSDAAILLGIVVLVMLAIGSFFNILRSFFAWLTKVNQVLDLLNETHRQARHA